MPPKKRVRVEPKEAVAAVSVDAKGEEIDNKEDSEGEMVVAARKRTTPPPISPTGRSSSSRNLRPRKSTCYTERDSPRPEQSQSEPEENSNAECQKKFTRKRRRLLNPVASSVQKNTSNVTTTLEKDKEIDSAKFVVLTGQIKDLCSKENDTDNPKVIEPGVDEKKLEKETEIELIGIQVKQEINEDVPNPLAVPAPAKPEKKKGVNKPKKKLFELNEKHATKGILPGKCKVLKVIVEDLKFEKKKKGDGSQNGQNKVHLLEPKIEKPEESNESRVKQERTEEIIEADSTATAREKSKQTEIEQRKSIERAIGAIIPSLNNPLLPLPPLPPLPNIIGQGFFNGTCFNSVVSVKESNKKVILKRRRKVSFCEDVKKEDGNSTKTGEDLSGKPKIIKRRPKKPANVTEIQVKIESEEGKENTEKQDGATGESAEKAKTKNRPRKKLAEATNTTAGGTENTNDADATLILIKVEKPDNPPDIMVLNHGAVETQAQPVPPVQQPNREAETIMVQEAKDDNAPRTPMENTSSNNTTTEPVNIADVINSLVLPPLNPPLLPLPPLPPHPIFTRRPGFFRGRRAKSLSSRGGRKEVIHREEPIDPEELKGFEHVERYVTPPGVRLSKFWDSEDELSDDDSNDNFRRIMCGFGTNCRLHEVIRPVSEIIRRSKELQTTFGAVRTLPLFPKPGVAEEETPSEADISSTSHDGEGLGKNAANNVEERNQFSALIWHNDPSYFAFANNFP